MIEVMEFGHNETCKGCLYNMFKADIIIIIMTRSDQPEPPAVAIVHQNGLSSASCLRLKLTVQFHVLEG